MLFFVLIIELFYVFFYSFFLGEQSYFENFTFFSLLQVNFLEYLQPFSCVWVFTLFIWTFLEITVLNAHYFNSKHTYVSADIKLLNSSYYFYKILRPTTKSVFLENLYEYYL